MRAALNLYAYVDGRPIVAYDPFGLKKVCCTEGPSKLFAEPEEAAKKAKEFADKGFIEVDPGAEVVAATYCMGGEKQGTAAVSFHPPFDKLGPCEKECVKGHEGVHVWVCKQFGPIVLGAAGVGAMDEAAGYMAEAACLATVCKQRVHRC